ncbi:MAG: GNAT family N-acetyltransferase [Chlorogloeopsis fritschii C42_A2020_084]|jgi:GNAT superfamily N-acetyltransferase|uniref:GNAT family N-acetyltransferase n=1 Tax=Chlorogloeopsis fritschii TaxID=1124 RepID=UPI0019E0BA27|nr:GNAT family N-acetyltransferase [Chlorogloeopsis fritschii]MBF2005674.1 GNAT family N-acetyltransferase [Chlorogloeopsis fritschii C42_A2020_084]
MDVYIRLACLEDIPVITSIIQESARTLLANCYTTKQIEGALGTIFDVDSQLIHDQTYFVAESKGQIVGCGGWSKRKTLYGGDQGRNTESESFLDPKVDCARIRAFFVYPNWARQGIGSQIMQKCEAAARDAGFNKIEIVATLAGELLYASFGYYVIQQFELLLPNGEVLPVVRMFKSFTND